jgi:hypothetical protein
MLTTYERGMIAERRESVLFQLEIKFGPLASAVKERVESLSPEGLRQIQVEILKAESLKALRLDG